MPGAAERSGDRQRRAVVAVGDEDLHWAFSQSVVTANRLGAWLYHLGISFQNGSSCANAECGRAYVAASCWRSGAGRPGFASICVMRHGPSKVFGAAANLIAETSV